MATQITTSIAADIDRRLLAHFENHSGSEITPAEWREAVQALVHEMVEERCSSAAFAPETVAEPDNSVRNETLAEISATFQSFVDRADSLGPSDKLDVSGMRRAINIIKKL